MNLSKIIENTGTFYLKKSTWDTLRSHQTNKTFPKQWSDIFSEQLSKLNPYCSFAFKHHYVTPIQNAPFVNFTAKFMCVFENCISGQINMNNSSLLQFQVKFNGTIHHSPKERHARPIRHQKRNELKTELKNKMARIKYRENINKLNEEIFTSGKRDDCPSQEVLRKIRSEAKKEYKIGASEITGLLELKKETTEQGSKVKGLLHCIKIHPPCVMLWTEATTKVFHELGKHDIVYLDATGSIMQKTGELTDKQYYLYELVVRHPVRSKLCLPVASMMTCDHTAASITNFLYTFQQSEAKLYGYSSITQPPLLMIDGSPVLLKSVLCVFNLENVLNFHKRCYRIVMGTALDGDLKLTNVHLCAAHFMKNAAAFCRAEAKGFVREALFWIGLLIKAKDMEEIDNILRSIVIITNEAEDMSLVKTHFDMLNKKNTRGSRNYQFN